MMQALRPRLGIVVRMGGGGTSGVQYEDCTTGRVNDGVWQKKKDFFMSIVRVHTHDKASEGKNWAMQSHGQVLPPCDCIAKIAAR